MKCAKMLVSSNSDLINVQNFYNYCFYVSEIHTFYDEDNKAKHSYYLLFNTKVKCMNGV